MDKEKLMVSPKSEAFTMTVVDMMGEEKETEKGEVKVSLGVDGNVCVSDNFGASETFLVALRCWSDGCNAQEGEDWLRSWPKERLQEEPEEAEEMVNGKLLVSVEELPRFPLVISEDLVVKEVGGGYLFEDSLGRAYEYEETVKIIKEMSDYFSE